MSEDINQTNVTENNKIILTDEQKLIILKRFEDDTKRPPSISELAKSIWPEITDEKEFDGRSVRCKVIKKFLGEKDIKPPTLEDYKNFNDKMNELTPAQKEYIDNNCQSMSAMEMGRELFNNKNLNPNDGKIKIIVKYIRENINPQILYNKGDVELMGEYRPPRKVLEVCARINSYVEGAEWDAGKISPKQKKCCIALMQYLYTYRFVHQASTYSEPKDRALFESTFIRYCYDKPELDQENVDQYIILSTEVVISANIQRTIDMLQAEQNRQMEENNGKLSMTLIEAINTARTEYNSSIKRQGDLYKSLIQERSKKLQEKIGDTATLLNLIETWKQKESRDQMIKIANERRQKLSEEIDRLETMDDLKVRIMGISKSEILDG